VRLGETNKRIQIITSVDMSTNTKLEIFATAPGADTSKTWVATIGGALSNITLEDGTTVATVAANESMYYDLAATSDVDIASTNIGDTNQVDWTLVPVWTDTATTPDKSFIGDPVTMVVLDDFYFA